MLTESRNIRLIASSASILGSGFDDCCVDLATIIAITQQVCSDDVTGAMALSRGRLYLVLEGPHSEVENEWGRIKDALHHLLLIVLQQGAVTVFQLPRVKLHFISEDPKAQAIFQDHLNNGITDGPDSEALMILEALSRAAEHSAQHRFAATANVIEACNSRNPPSSLLIKTVSDPMDEFSSCAEIEALDATYITAVLSWDKTIIRVNASYANLLGYERTDLEGQPYASTLSAMDESHLSRLWRSMHQGNTVRVDHRALCRNGRNIWIRSTYRPRLDSACRLLDVTEIVADITSEKLRQLDERGQISAINRSQAIIHFTLEGTITEANELFLSVMGYTREEVIGRHHRMFVDPIEAASEEYASFWQGFAEGRFRSAEYRRVAKDGRPVWLQATYNPILDMAGQPFKIVKYAVDVSAEKLQRADYEWQIAAIHKSNAVITFDMGGVIIDANDNFLAAFGYCRDEVIGHHHRMFVEEKHSHSAEYAQFWQILGQGVYQSGQYTRIHREGFKVWLQATYNPIFDIDGKPFKIVKYATITTAEKLHQSDYQGQIAAIHRAQAVASYGLDGTILDANRKFLDLLGYRLAELRGQRHTMLLGPTSSTNSDFWSTLAAGHFQSGEFRHVRRDGTDVWFQATYNPIFDLDGRAFKIVQYATDVTAQKLRQAAVDGQLAAIHQSQGVLILSLHGTIIEINDTLLGVLGYTRGEVLGRPHRLFLDTQYANSSEYAAFWKTLNTGGFIASRCRHTSKDGREIWLHATYNQILDVDGQPLHIVGLTMDVTADVAVAHAFQDAQQRAHHDTVTGLPNRERLLAHIAEALADPEQRIVILYLDLDRFKPVNDTFGHHAGDRVLSEVAARIQASLAPDQLAARVGGDEFVIVADGLRYGDIEALCQRLITTVAKPIADEAGNLSVGASIGVAVGPTDGNSADQLLRAADSALYRSKQRGRGMFSFYAPTMDNKVRAYRTLIGDMRQALDLDQFYLEYQPRFETRTRTIRSVEALIRWAHPIRGRISPLEFIPIAEKSGLIDEVGEWTLRTACRSATLWPNIVVSVNVSPIQIRTIGFVSLVAEILAETGLASNRLELELTEGALIDDSFQSRETLSGLKRLGVSLAVDDFGIGFSSLGLLKSFPFDRIKIDRQFVADIGDSERDRGVIRAILALGNALNMNVTVEGVETLTQLSILDDLGCDEIQGFFLSRPLAPTNISSLLAPDQGQIALADRLSTQFIAA